LIILLFALTITQIDADNGRKPVKIELKRYFFNWVALTLTNEEWVVEGEKNFFLGIDFGTDSVRVLVVSDNGLVAGSAVTAYERWGRLMFCDPERNQFRQHPLDHIESLQTAARAALKEAGPKAAAGVRGVSVDTTGSSPVAVDEKGTPLALHDDLKDDPDAMFILWKDHTAIREAEEINTVAASWDAENYLKYVGGVYSSEWFWAKILHVLRKNPDVGSRAHSWMEHCDWISAHLAGNTDPAMVKRSRCAAGHKALWHESFGGLPPDAFFTQIDSRLSGLRERLYRHTYTSDVRLGTLSAQWAGKLGLPDDVAVGVGAFDAHMGAVGGQIEPYALSKVMGTSTCDILIAPLDEVKDMLVRGICGQVDGSVVPGMMGMEAGQSAFGDVYAWFADLLAWPVVRLSALGKAGKALTSSEVSSLLLKELTQAASGLTMNNSGVIALDWLNGRRTPFAKQDLKGALLGLNLGTDAPKIFRALVEATAFGARKIMECFTSQGIPIKSMIGLGGVAKKSPFIMQVIADVMGIPLKIVRSEECCALGAAMFAAVASGVFPRIEDAQAAMGSGFETEYRPNPDKAAGYDLLYKKYDTIGRFVEKELTAPGP
jgi:L-ribulokinase